MMMEKKKWLEKTLWNENELYRTAQRTQSKKSMCALALDWKYYVPMPTNYTYYMYVILFNAGFFLFCLEHQEKKKNNFAVHYLMTIRIIILFLILYLGTLSWLQLMDLILLYHWATPGYLLDLTSYLVCLQFLSKCDVCLRVIWIVYWILEFLSL